MSRNKNRTPKTLPKSLRMLEKPRHLPFRLLAVFTTLLLLTTLAVPATTANAQVAPRDRVTWVLPEDFGVDRGVGYEGFSQCTESPPYVCDLVVIKNNDRVIFTEDIDFTVEQSFQLEEGISFNDECFAVNVTAEDNFVLKKNGRFTGNVVADKEIKLEEDAEMNGDATSNEPKIEIGAGAAINGMCTPESAIEGEGTCGGVSQCGIPLALVKTPNRFVLSPGDLLTYTLDFSNEGSTGVVDAALTDIVPPNTTFIRATGGGSEVGGVVTWTGDLDGGEESSVTLDVRVNNDTANGTVLTNDALLQAQGATEARDSVDVIVEFSPLLTLDKQANVEVAAPGERITYTLTVENVGNRSATNVALVDTIDPNTTFISATGGGTESNGVVTWTAAEIQSGSVSSVTVTVEVNAGVPDGTLIVNTSTVDSFETAPVDAQEIVTVQTVPRLDLVKRADSDVVEAGEVLTYSLAFENIGSVPAENATLTDTLPADTMVESISGGGMETSPGVVTWDLGTLTPGEAGQVQLAVRVDAPLPDDTRLINRSTLTADDVEEPAYAETETRVAARPVLNLRKVGDKTVVSPGDTLTYTITALNTGNATASNLVLEDTLPANTTFVSASGNGQNIGGRIVWTIPELTINIPQTFVLVVQVDTPLADQTQIFNNATLFDNTQSVTADFVSTVKSEAILQLSKTASAVQVSPGEEITYTLVLENTGNAIAENLIAEDQLPAFTTFVSASDGGQLIGDKVIWTADTLAPGTRAEFFLTVVTDTPLDNGTRIYNVITVDADATRAVTADAESFVNSAPVLVLDKTVDKPVASPGDQLTYTLNVANAGNANAANARLEDTLPPNTSFVSATGDFTRTGDTISWSVPTLPAGAAGAVTLTVQVVSPLDTGTTILNSATLDADNAPPTTSTAITQIDSIPLLELTKTASANPVTPGALLTYQLVASNAGNANATAAEIVDLVPDNTTFVSASAGGQFADGAVTWDLGTLLVGSPATVTLTVQVDTPLDNGTVITNNARLSAANAPDATATNSVTVNSAPALSIVKRADKDIVEPGDLLNYTLEVGNSGNAISRNTVVFDLLPNNTTFVSASPQATVNGREVTWRLGDVTPGETPTLRLNVQVDSPLDDATIITNNAAVGSDNADPKVAAHEAVVQSSPVLELTKTADRSVVQPGDQLTFTLRYANTGNADAPDAVLSDPVPELLSFVSATGGGTLENDNVTWDLGRLDAGAVPGEVTVTFRVDGPPIDDGTAITNTATLEATGGTPVTASAGVNVQSAPVLTLDKSTSTPVVQPGEQLTFRLAYGNVGNDNADDVVLEDAVPAFTTFVSASGGGTLMGDTVVWNLGTLEIGKPGEVTVTFQVDGPPLADGTAITNTATLDATDVAPVSDAETVTVSSAPRITLDKTVDQATVQPGQELTYTLAVSNVGTDTAVNLVLEDDIPADTTFVAATGGGQLTGNTVTWTAAALAPGVSGSVSLTVRVDTPLDNGTVIYNAATLDADNAASATDEAASTVSSSPRLTLTKEAGTETVAPGQALTYRLAYGNTGNADATDVVLEELVPEFTSFVRASDGGTLQGDLVVWQADELLAGTAGEVTVTVLVDGPPLADGTQIRNFATLSAADAPPVTARDRVTVTSSPVLTVTKEADRAFARPGDEISYTIAVRNTGTDTASNVVVTDQLPAATSLLFASGDFDFDGQAITWTFAELAPEQVLDLVVIVQVDSPLADNTVLENVVTTAADNAAPATDSAVTRVQSNPALRLDKATAATLVQPGETVDFTLTVGNDGTANAIDGTLEDTIPSNSSFVSATDGGVFADGRVVWPVPQLPAGAEASVGVTVRVDNDVSNGDLVTNTATLAMAGETPLTATASVTVQAAPVLSISKASAISQALPGDTVRFELDYANTGNDTARGVTVTDPLPANTAFVDAPGGSFDGAVVRWDLGDLGPGAAGTLNLDVQILPATEAGTIVTNRADMTASNAPATASNPVDVQVIAPAGPPQLTVAIVGNPLEIEPGQSLVYDVSYGNLATTDALDTVLVAILPRNTVFENASNDGQLLTAGGLSWVQWDLGTLAGNGSGTVTFRVRYETPDGRTAQRPRTVAPPESFDTRITVRSLALITASNASPPQAAVAENFVRIEDVVAPYDPIPVPTLSALGLVLFAGLMLAAAGLAQRRRRRSAFRES